MAPSNDDKRDIRAIQPWRQGNAARSPCRVCRMAVHYLNRSFVAAIVNGDRQILNDASHASSNASSPWRTVLCCFMKQSVGHSHLLASS
jgi:hypothetical protein